MILIGCDFHPSWQQVCWLNMASGETNNQKLVHASGDAEKFYRRLAVPVRVGIEATGNCQWFLELLGKLGHEVRGTLKFICWTTFQVIQEHSQEWLCHIRERKWPVRGPAISFLGKS